ncbi:TIGR03618 family F420-dependent PPOX class oxidoreductase [Leifsonia sp. YIM 134122]|uniref:TIGR03618 family F420-dependent PPOX class oxidoreductase n=1 Tax=Leifsonia stereocauli TaxID=3134136 RepID=A0ABU9W487_9MICO
MTKPARLSPDGLAFVTDRHLATLSTIAPDGSIHVVAVGFTVEQRDSGELIARIITSGPSQKVRNVERGVIATIGQVEGRQWLSLAGTAEILRDPESVADAVERYSARYRRPQPNPLRVVIAITVTKLLGSASLLEK